MLRQIDLHDEGEARSLLALQRAAYAQEAALINYPDLPPLRETLEQLMACGETVLGWCADGQWLGAIGFLDGDAGVEICRLVVAPAAQRQGIARQLLAAVCTQAAGRPVQVGTAAANTPAVALYQAMGFAISRRFATPDGLALLTLTRH
ncbi:GNAT family N-acetyltransferase [Chitinimonas sp.]|uniref:GNAT family N-acetyltransferase n=1 Tax=Chitinimonas sp. TaxID=1934313 RepID=UPI0035AF50E8